MDFETFKENLVKDVKSQLDERFGSDTTVEIHTVDKMNESYEAVTVKPEGSNIGVNINATEIYKSVQDGADYGTVVDKAVDMAENALDNRPDFDLTSIMDYEQMKSKLTMEVVSAERNAELLQTVPHKNMEDMAVVYRFLIDSTDEGRSSILVTNKMLDNYGITPEQLHADAVKNAPEIRPIVIQGMAEVLAKQMGVEDLEMLGLNIPPEQEQIFVASVPDNIHGAGVLAYEDFMDKAAERAGGDFYILPSSIHELLIVPDNGMMDLKSLENMVREVNATTVDPSDKLTDNVYHYDSKDKIFELGEKHLLREAVKEREAEMGQKSGEKKSLLGELKAAKDEASKQSVKDAVDKGVKSKGDVAI